MTVPNPLKHDKDKDRETYYLEALEKERAKVELKINEQKTTYMIVARMIGRFVTHFEVVKEFVYLSTNDVSLEIQTRI
jgi:hypothetical protein